MRWVGRWLVLLMVLCPLGLYLPGSPLGSISVLQAALVPLLALLVLTAVLSPEQPVFPLVAPVVLLALFATLCLLALAWSPVRTQAVLTTVKIGGLILVVVAAASVEPQHRRAAARVLAATAAALAAMVIVFRLFPLIEEGFLYTRAASLTFKPDLLAGLRSGTVRINTMASNRAGGVFTNANSAGLFLGMVLVLAWTTERRPRVWLFLLTPLLTAGIAATGSKAALLAFLLAVAFVIAHVLRRHLTLARALLIVGGSFVGVALLVLFVWQAGLLSAGQQAAGTRFEIWHVGLPVLLQHPILGLGFGGWQRWAVRTFRFEGIAQIYPPQNLLLIAWAWAGVPGAVLAGTFVVTLLAAPRLAGKDRGLDPWVREGLTVLFGWFVLQSMFTNAAFTDIRIGIPLGLALGTLCANPTHRLELGPGVGTEPVPDGDRT